jgi:hypothetical protein
VPPTLDSTARFRLPPAASGNLDGTARVRTLATPPPAVEPPTLDSTARFRGPTTLDGTARFRMPPGGATTPATPATPPATPPGDADGTSRFRSPAASLDGTARFRSPAASLDGTARFRSPAASLDGTARFRAPATSLDGTAGFATVAMPIPPEAAKLLDDAAPAPAAETPAAPTPPTVDPDPSSGVIAADLELPTLAPASPPRGGRNAAKSAGRGGKKDAKSAASRTPRHPDAEARESLVVADAVRLLKWGREWHELGEAIARMAGRPGVGEIRRILRAHKNAIEKQRDA